MQSPRRCHLSAYSHVPPSGSEMRSDLWRCHSRLARPQPMSTHYDVTHSSLYMRSKVTESHPHVATSCKRRVTSALAGQWSRALREYESARESADGINGFIMPRQLVQALLTCTDGVDEFPPPQTPSVLVYFLTCMHPISQWSISSLLSTLSSAQLPWFRGVTNLKSTTYSAK